MAEEGQREALAKEGKTPPVDPKEEGDEVNTSKKDTSLAGKAEAAAEGAVDDLSKSVSDAPKEVESSSSKKSKKSAAAALPKISGVAPEKPDMSYEGNEE